MWVSGGWRTSDELALYRSYRDRHLWRHLTSCYCWLWDGIIPSNCDESALHAWLVEWWLTMPAAQRAVLWREHYTAIAGWQQALRDAAARKRLIAGEEAS